MNICTAAAPLISSVGLLLDIIGALIIYQFGLPENINRNGETTLGIPDTDKNEVSLAKLYDKMSLVGIFLLITGFFLQGISNWI